MITEEFLNSMSPRPCRLFRRFIVVNDVPIDIRPAYPLYHALLNLLRMNKTLENHSISANANNDGESATQNIGGTSARSSNMATWSITKTIRENNSIHLSTRLYSRRLNEVYGGEPVLMRVIAG
jgi:hypothetical protein